MGRSAAVCALVVLVGAPLVYSQELAESQRRLRIHAATPTGGQVVVTVGSKGCLDKSVLQMQPWEHIGSTVKAAESTTECTTFWQEVWVNYTVRDAWPQWEWCTQGRMDGNTYGSGTGSNPSAAIDAAVANAVSNMSSTMEPCTQYVTFGTTSCW